MNHLPYAEPGLKDLLDLYKADTMRSMNCVSVGKIVSYSTSSNTAKIKLQFKRQYDNDTPPLDSPYLVDCPVFNLCGGGAFLSMPITVGDFCIVLFSDKALDSWYQTGLESVPGSPRTHSFSDGIALVGIQPSTSPLSVSATKVLLDAGSHLLQIQNDNKNLKTLVGKLLDYIGNMSVVSGALQPTTIHLDMSNLKAEFDLLLG